MKSSCLAITNKILEMLCQVCSLNFSLFDRENLRGEFASTF